MQIIDEFLNRMFGNLIGDHKAYLDAENERWERKAKFEEEMRRREEERRQTANEWRKCRRWQEQCSEVVFRYCKELDDEEFKEWVLAENYGPCIPLSFGKMLKRYEKEGKYLPITKITFI